MRGNCTYGEVSPPTDPDYGPDGGGSVYSPYEYESATFEMTIHDRSPFEPGYGDVMRVTMEYTPSPYTLDVYQTEITLENISDENITHVKYRKTADFDGKTQ